MLSPVHTKPRAVFVRQSTKFSQCVLCHQLKLVLVCFFSADSMLNRRRSLSFSRVIWSLWLAVQLANQYTRKAQNGHAIWPSGVEYQLGVSGQLWTQTQTVAVNYLQKKKLNDCFLKSSSPQNSVIHKRNTNLENILSIHWKLFGFNVVFGPNQLLFYGQKKQFLKYLFSVL